MNSLLLPIAQIAVAILLIISILLQQRGSSLGSAFGGGSDFYSTRRGIEKKVFTASIVLGAILIALALLNLIGIQ